LEILRHFSDIGVKTTVFFGPIYPNVNLSDIQKYVEIFMENGASEIMFDKFNLKPGILKNLSKIIPQYESVIKNVDYYNNLFDEIKRVCSYKCVKVTSAF
jgi:DNA repair photolyase